MLKLTTLLISCAFARIELELDGSLVVLKEAIKRKPDIVWSTIVLCEISTTRAIFAPNDLIVATQEKVRFPNSYVIIRNDLRVLERIDVVKFTEIVTLDTIRHIKPYVRNLTVVKDENRFRRTVFLVNEFAEEDLRLLKPTFRFVWDSFIWNCNIVFMWRNKLHDNIYNPFTDVVHALKENRDFANQFDKFTNLYGYEIKVSMVPDPRLTYENGLLEGNFVRVLKEIGRILNASFAVRLEESLSDAYNSVRNRETEFCFVGQFHGIRNGVKFSEPFKRDDIILLVPKAEELPKFMNLLYIFPIAVWAFIISLLTIYSALIYLIQRKDLSLIILNIYVITQGLAIVVQKKTCPLTRILYVSLMFFGIIINSVYNSSMLAAIISRRFHKEINTLSAFLESGLPICTLSELKTLIPPEFGSNVLYLPRLRLSDMILERKTKCGYTLMRSHGEAYIRELTNLHGNGHYHIVEESFIPGFESFFFQPSSPFIYKINKVMKRIEESGLFLYADRLRVAKRKDFSKFVPLTLLHFRAIFIILGIGYVAGTLAFTAEVLYFRLRKLHEFMH